MKKFILALTALLCLTASVQAMSYEQARQQALFLTDKMAYELNLTDDQYEAAYEINLDYLMGVNTVDDLYGPYWQRRNLDLSYVLLSWQYSAFCNAAYFYRPLYWNAGYWHFGIYARYPYRDYFFFGRPTFYVEYRGAHSWHMNGGRSWYHGRHYGPRPGRNDHPRGMRDGFQRGDYGNGFQGNPNSATSFGTARRPPMMGNPNTQFGSRPNTQLGSRPNNAPATSSRPQTNNGTTFGSGRGGSNTPSGNGSISFGSGRGTGASTSGNGTGFSFGRRESSTRNTVTRPTTTTTPSSSFGSGRGTSSTSPRSTFTPGRSTSSSRDQIITSPRSSQSTPTVSSPSRSTSSFGSGRSNSSFGSGRSTSSFGSGRSTSSFGSGSSSSFGSGRGGSSAPSRSSGSGHASFGRR